MAESTTNTALGDTGPDAAAAVTPIAFAGAARAGIRTGLCFFHSKNGLRWRLWDFLLALSAFWIGFAISPYTEKMPAVWYMMTVGGLYGFLLSLVSRTCGIPQPEHRVSTYELLVTCLLAVGMAYFIFNAIVGLTLVRTYGRYIVITTTGLSTLGLFLPRYLLARLMEHQPLNVIVYGAGGQGAVCVERLLGSKLFHVLGMLDHNPALRGTRVHNVPVLGSIREWNAERLGRSRVDLVVLCVGSNLITENAGELARLRGAGVELLTMGALFEQYFKMVVVDDDSLHWFASRPFILHNSSNLVVKRLLDVAVASVGLAFTLPLWLLIAVGIKLDSPGPVFFRQTRVKRHGGLFTIYKFRTMCVDAEKNGAQWAQKNDPRVTRFGRFLRVSRLDELPQLWNVIRGDMAIVGPRPERPEFVDRLCQVIPFYDQRHLLPPGLTGWAQIRYRYGATEEDAARKLAYDLYYIRNASLTLDLEIMLRTIPMLMKGSR